MGLPPWSSAAIVELGSMDPVAMPSAVSQGIVWLVIQMVSAMMMRPENRVRKRLPLCTPTAMAMKKPMVARSAKGSTRLPGISTASSRVSGMKMSPAVTTCESPRRIAGSRPM